MINDLLKLSIINISPLQIAQLILYILKELSIVQKHISNLSFQDYLTTGFYRGIVFDPLTVPDIVWRNICVKYPRISCYPLGEVGERSLKKTIVEVLSYSFNCYSQSEVNNKNNAHHTYELIKTKPLDLQQISAIFITQLFFEFCAISLRAKINNKADWGYAYQFQDGKQVSIEDQLHLRKQLKSGCEKLANVFISLIAKSLNETIDTLRFKTVSEAIQKTLPFVVWRVDTPKQKTKPSLNVVVGTNQLSTLRDDYIIEDDYLRIILDGINKNVTFSLSDIEQFLGHPIHSLVKDLLEISFVIYISDLYITRDENLARPLNIIIPVRHEDIWIRETTNLQQTISFLARDNVNLYFTHKKDKVNKNLDFKLVEDSKDCVNLLSGGIDSATGTLWATENGYNPTLVSYSPGNLSGIQTRLVNEIEKCINRNLSHLVISWQPSKKKKGSYRLGKPVKSILYQHLRSFFYLGIASSIAIESKYNKVFMFESGPISINPLLSEAHINTRTTHPVFLDLYNDLVNRIFNTNLSLKNPFISKTKSQIISNIHNKEWQLDIIPKTTSCFSYSRIKAYAKEWLDNPEYVGTHDGDCLPCIVRRISLNQAKIPDKYDEHLIDIFNLKESPIFLKMPEHSIEILVRIADLLRFHEAIKHLPLSTIVCLFPDMYPFSESIDSETITDMFKQYSNEVINCFLDKLSPDMVSIFNNALLTEATYAQGIAKRVY